MEAAAGQDEPGWWCADNDIMCPLVWWCGVRGIVTSTLIGVGCWAALFVTLCIVLRPVAGILNARFPSKIPGELNISWLALTVQSTFHATLIVYLVFAALLDLHGVKPSAQFDAPSVKFAMHKDSVASVANTSHVFFTYTIVDTFITFWRKEMTIDYFCHHMVFIFFCIIIQYDCFAPYLAGWLLVMEISTIFLNGFTFWRNRLGYGHWVVQGSFLLFAISFVLVRLCGTTYVAIYWACVVYHRIVPFVGIPRWHLNVLMVALIGAVGIQVFWAWNIGKKVVKMMKPAKSDEAKTK